MQDISIYSNCRVVKIAFSILNRAKSKNKFCDGDLTLALVGNPNVGKSTVFNRLTGMNQHTGNWSGKTVSLTSGRFMSDDKCINLIDLPGAYSLLTDSPEENVTKDYILSNDYGCIIIVVDVTSLERNLNLVLQILNITSNAVLCLNFMDEIKRKGICIDIDELSLQLGIPVVGISARYNRGVDKLIDTAIKVSEGKIKTHRVKNIAQVFESNYKTYEENSEKISALSRSISESCVGIKGEVYSSFDKKLDKLLLSPYTGIPLMLLVFAVVFWLTAFGANYPGQLLSYVFEVVKYNLSNLLSLLGATESLRSFIVDGIYTTVSWVVTVMLPPALIFFPLFAVLEDTGILPRFAFNLDRIFKNSGTNGKQALTMLMGFGCNACGVMGCRIIKSKQERICAIVTNSFIPCNGRLPTLIALISVFFCADTNGFLNSVITMSVLLLILIVSVLITLLVNRLVTLGIKDDKVGNFILELPPYRRPQILKVILLSIKDKVLYVLSRAIIVSIPAGAILWLISNLSINDISLISYVSDYLNPFAKLFGIDGVILTAIFLSFPANEILIPIMLMVYYSGGMLTEYSSISQLETMLADNGWTQLTALCVIILCVFHFPCSTTCFSVKKETGSVFWTILSVIIPLIVGMVLCFAMNFVFSFA